jgi:hypothetical protein
VQNQTDPHSRPANRGDIKINGSDPFDTFDTRQEGNTACIKVSEFFRDFNEEY